MKLTIPAKLLSTALNLLKPVAKHSAQHPTLGNVALIADTKKTLRLIGTDLEKRMEIALPAKVKELGSITLNCARFASFVELSTEGDCEFATKEMTATYRIGKHTGNRPGLPIEEMPPWPEPKANGHSFTIPAPLWNECLTKCLVQAHKEEDERAVLCSIVLVSREGQLNIQATDGRRIIICYTPIIFDCGKESFFIPRDSIQALSNVATEGDIKVSVSEGILRGANEHAAVSTKLIEASFPDFEKAFQKDMGGAFTCNREALLLEIRRAESYLTEAKNSVLIECSGDELEITGSDTQQGDGKGTLDCKDGKVCKFACNPQFLSDALKSFSEDEVTIQKDDGVNHIVIKNDTQICSVATMVS